MPSDPSSSSAAAAAAVAALSAARDAAAALLAGRGALDDFERLRARAQRAAPAACAAALRPENRGKNRYSDVLAPDHSRVVLRASLEEVARGGGGGAEGREGAAAAAAANERGGQLSPPPPPAPPPSTTGGYINASLLSSRPGERPTWSYVAAQGPLPSTVLDFWTLVAQLRSPVVVSLTRPEERGVEKCARYLPAAAYGDANDADDAAARGARGDDLCLPHSAVFGGIRVSCGRAWAAGPGLVARRVAVEICAPRAPSSPPPSPPPPPPQSPPPPPSSLPAFRHSLLHFHVDDWPDHGAPASSASLRAAAAAMRGAVDGARERAREAGGGGGAGDDRGAGVVGPPVVHCSAGASSFAFFFLRFFPLSVSFFFVFVAHSFFLHPAEKHLKQQCRDREDGNSPGGRHCREEAPGRRRGSGGGAEQLLLLASSLALRRGGALRRRPRRRRAQGRPQAPGPQAWDGADRGAVRRDRRGGARRGGGAAGGSADDERRRGLPLDPLASASCCCCCCRQCFRSSRRVAQRRRERGGRLKSNRALLFSLV